MASNEDKSTLQPLSLGCPSAPDLTIPRGYRFGIREIFRLQPGDKPATLIAHRLIIISGRGWNPRTQEMWARLSWVDLDGNWVHREVPRDVPASQGKLEKLSIYGAPVNSNNARQIVSFLAALEAVNAAVLPRRMVVDAMGWTPPDDRGRRGCVIGTTVIGPAELAVDVRPMDGGEGILTGWQERGSMAGWQKAVAPVLERFPVVGVFYLASLASPLLSLIEEPSFVVDLSGETSRGKTTTLQVAASVFGSPMEGEGAIQSWDATRVALERIGATLGNLPLLLDESKRAGRAGSTAKMIYDLTAGSGRARGSIDGLRHRHTWHLTVLSTGEAPITESSQDAGTRARTLCITEPPFGEGDQSAVVQQLTDGLRAHHGWAGRCFVAELLTKDPRQLQEDYSEYRLALAREVESKVGGRLVGHAAVLLLTLDLASFAGLPVPDAQAVRAVLLRSIEAGSRAADRPREALRDLVSHAHVNIGRLWQPDIEQPGSPARGWLGVKDCERLALSSSESKEYLKTLGYDVPGVIHAWVERGWLEVSRQDTTKRVRFAGGQVRCLVFPSAVVERVMSDEV